MDAHDLAEQLDDERGEGVGCGEAQAGEGQVGGLEAAG